MMWSLVSTVALLSVWSVSVWSEDVHTVRVCTSSQAEVDSCTALNQYYFNHSRLRVDCQGRNSSQQCYQAFLDYKVDVVSLNPKIVNNYSQLYLKDAYQQIDEASVSHLPLVVVTKTSTIERLGGTVIEKACISNLRDIPSWWTTYVIALFRASHGRYESPYSKRYRTGMIFGDLEVTDDPLECLGSNDKGVAILGEDSATKKFAEGMLKAEDYKLICFRSSEVRKSIDEYRTCNGYGLNFTGNSTEEDKQTTTGKEILKIAAHTSHRYMHIDYFNLVYNYQRDFKVFFSNASSAASFLEQELSTNIFP